MESRSRTIFSGITVHSNEHQEVVEKADPRLYPDSASPELEEIRSDFSDQILLIPEKSDGQDYYFAKSFLAPFSIAYPVTAQDFTQLIKYLEKIVQLMAALHHCELGTGMLTEGRLWQDDSGNLRVLGFHLIRPSLEVPNVSLLSKEDLLYLPPEYSEQFKFAPDHRADFYSLGILLYKWLSGHFPFSGSDGMEIIHQHLSKKPRLLRDYNEQVPPMLERIVMALLEKDPDNRYQSADGILEDVHKLLASDELVFSLSLSYSPGILKIKNKLYGRDRELGLLSASYQKAKEGQQSLVLISGYSGVGKTALVSAFEEGIPDEAHFFLSGKFDQFQNVPYAALINAIENLIDQLLFLPESTVQEWKNKILRALGENTGVITEIIPKLEILIGEQPIPEKLSPIETQNRFSYTFLQFCRLFASADHPMVWFIDDWQWCDIPSIQFLQKLLEEDMPYFLLIAAYRDNEIHEGHPFSMLLKDMQELEVRTDSIRLGNLKQKHVNQLISEAIGEQMNYTKSLAQVIYQKTQGNAFFTRQFLYSLWDQQLLFFDYPSTHWQWNLDKIIEENVSENVLELMSGKIESLPSQAQILLKIGAFFGATFYLQMLSGISGLEKEKCQKYIKYAEKAGLLIHLKRKGVDQNGQYSFVHDRVQQAAYALEISGFEYEKNNLHYLLGKNMVNSNKFLPGEKAIHFIHSLELVEEDIKDEVVNILIEAGKIANDSNSPDAAYEYFKAAQQLSSQKQTYFTIQKGLMQAAFLLNKVEEAEGFAEEAISVAPDKLTKSEVYVLQLMFYESLALFEKNIYCGVEALQLMDVDIKEQLNMSIMESLVQDEYFRFLELTKGKQPSDFRNMPAMTDPEQAAILDILVNMNASAYFADLYLFAWCTLRMGSQTLQYGKADSTPFAFGFLGALLAALYQKFELGYQFGKVGVDMLKNINSNRYRCRTLSIFTIFIQHIKEPILNGIPGLKESVHIGLETGDLPYAGYSMYAQVRDQFLACDSLSKVMNICQLSIEFMDKFNNAGLLALMRLFRANLKLLMGGYDEAVAEEEKEALRFLIEIKFFTAVAHHYIFKSWALCILKRDEEAWGYLQKNQSVLIYASSQSHVPKHYFLQSLVLLRKKKKLSQSELAIIENNQSILKKWSSSMPENFRAEFEIIEALRAQQAGQWPDILKYFKHAVTWAQKGKLLGIESMIYELCADVMEEGGLSDLTTAYLSKARQTYASWGAKEKLVALRGEGETIPSGEMEASVPIDYDTRSLLKATQAISAEVSKDALVKRLLQITLENAGAEKGVLLLKYENDFFVEAEINTSREVYKSYNQQELEKSDSIPPELIRYVIRSGEELLLDHTEQFVKMNDPYFEKNEAKSVLVLPIKKGKELIGILYLENDYVAGLFQKNRLQILRTIASQAAISIVNTRLFEHTTQLNQQLMNSQEELRKMNELLEERIRERTKILREEIEMRKGMEVQLKQAKETADNANLAKSQFLANMSHEIRSPLNAIVGFSQILINQSRKLDLPSEFNRYLNNIKISGQNLSELINDILDLSKIEAGKMTLSEEDMNLRQLIQSIFHIHKATAKEKGIVLQYDFDTATPQYVWSDRSKLKQILMNLLSNAIKFTPAGKHVFLKSAFVNDELLLEVKDEGIGISEEKQASIFDPFVQADASITREYEGTGLGLAITQNMVNMLGGRIELESELGRGATFRVYIPYHEPVRITTEKAEILLDKVEIPTNARILVVEDNPMNQEMIKAFFNEMHHEVLMANDGQEGVTMAEQYQPDLIFMDIHMPGMDGFAAMRKIRQKDEKTPIVALSADAFTEQQKRAISAGFTDYITKPIQVTRVIECLQKYLIKSKLDVPASEKSLSPKEHLQLLAIFDSIEQTPVYETEKLVELLESTAALTASGWREAVLDAVYAGDEKSIKKLLNDLKNQ